MTEKKKIRLARAIAQAGITSRRKAEELIRKGLVRVNGRIITEPGTRIDPDRDTVEVAGQSIQLHQPRLALLLYKPQGVISSVTDPRGRTTVVDLVRLSRAVQEAGVRLYPVGRLDYNSEGLMILTNDGELALRIMHPRYGCHKTYHVKCKGYLTKKARDRLLEGVRIQGKMYRALSIHILRKTQRNTWVEVVLGEGKKQQLRKMFLKVGHPVRRLIRVAIGPLTIAGLKPGQYRLLTEEEIQLLYSYTHEPQSTKRDGIHGQ